MGYAPYFFPCTLEVSQNPVSCSVSSAPWGNLIINGGSRGRRGFPLFDSGSWQGRFYERQR